MSDTSGLQYVPVDFDQHIVPLGEIKRIELFDPDSLPEYDPTTADVVYRSSIEVEHHSLFTTLSPEDCCQRMWNAIRMLKNGY